MVESQAGVMTVTQQLVDEQAAAMYEQGVEDFVEWLGEQGIVVAKVAMLGEFIPLDMDDVVDSFWESVEQD